MPQFAAALRPVQSPNPVTDTASTTNSAFFRATATLKPFAVNEQYEELGGRLLAEGSRIDAGTLARPVAPIAAFGLLLGWWTRRLVRRHDVAEAFTLVLPSANGASADDGS